MSRIKANLQKLIRLPEEVDFCRKSILDNYIEMWDSLAITGKVHCLHSENYLIVHSEVDDPGFNILIPKGKITKENFDWIKNYYKTKRKSFTIMSPKNHLVEIKEQLAPFFLHKMYGLARETSGTAIFKNELSNKFSFSQILTNSYFFRAAEPQEFQITRDWSSILNTSFSMTKDASEQFVDILHSYGKVSDNFNHNVAYVYTNEPTNWNVIREVGERSVVPLREHTTPQMFYETNSEKQKSINREAASICSIFYSKSRLHAGLYNGASLGKHPDYKPFITIVNKHINDAYNNEYKWVISQSTPAAANALIKYLGFKIMDLYSYYKVYC